MIGNYLKANRKTRMKINKIRYYRPMKWEYPEPYPEWEMTQKPVAILLNGVYKKIE